MNRIYQGMATTVFERMSLAATKHGAVNLGQGFPDFGWPEEILREAARALATGSNQYPPSRGLPQLRDSIASHYARQQGLSVSADQVCVTSGATEAIAASLLAVIEAGDEVIIFTPAYDAYAPLIRRAGGTVREVALEPPDWRIDADALALAVGPRTRAILFNNPHNPMGRLFEAAELEVLAAISSAHNLVVISDEVWEHVLLDGQRFTPIAALPGMAERTIKIGSAGKIFSLTGWKVGWLVAHPSLTSLVARAHQFLTFATPPNLQAAVAFGLDQGDPWIAPMRERFASARDRMRDALVRAGYAVLDCASTYFLCVDLRESGISMDDEEFAQIAVEHGKVAVIPISAFAETDPPRHLVRLCFAKRDDTIDAGVAAMKCVRDRLG
jgi:aspartate/methionine/tyrosine aminotransferase